VNDGKKGQGTEGSEEPKGMRRKRKTGKERCGGRDAKGLPQMLD